MLSSEYSCLFLEMNFENSSIFPLSKDGMTVLHLAAKFGHVDVLEVLRGKVPWSMASVKVREFLWLQSS